VSCHIQTGGLGYYVDGRQYFRVVTPAQADQAQAVCAFMRRLQAERWYDPLWWTKNFDALLNKIDQTITQIAQKGGVDNVTLTDAKSLVKKDLTARINAMIDAFRAPRLPVE
jgi:hypothetical protein